MAVTFPIQPQPAKDWPQIAAAACARREELALSREQVAEAIDVDVDDIAAFESGEPALGTHELMDLAAVLGTRTGVWFFGDTGAMFRGASDEDSAAALALASELMTEYLRIEALAEG